MIPDDLQTWIERTAAGAGTPFDEDGVTFLEPGTIPNGVHEGYLEPSYLSAEERSQPDIAANLKAHAETIALIAWAAEDEDGTAFGYWTGPEATPLGQAPVVSLDSEGTYSLLPGRTLSDGLAWHLDGYSHDFTEFASLCSAAGVELSAEATEELPDAQTESEPSTFHQNVYRKHLES